MLDVRALLRDSVKRRRTILTVPWLVEFLSMLDEVGALLPCYRAALGTLLLLYRWVRPQRLFRFPSQTWRFLRVDWLHVWRFRRSCAQENASGQRRRRVLPEQAAAAVGAGLAVPGELLGRAPLRTEVQCRR